MKTKKGLFKLMALAISSLLITACNQGGTPEHDHVWDQGTITTPATCQAEGVKTFHCTVSGCSQTKTENVSKTPHNWNEGTITQMPTCQQTGVKTFACQNEGCDATRTTSLPKIDHDFHEGDYTRIPDLLEKGERKLVCSMCDLESLEEVAAHADLEEQFDKSKSHWSFAYLNSFDQAQETVFPTLIDKQSGKYTHDGVEFSKGYLKANGIAALMYSLEEVDEVLDIDVNVKFEGKNDSTRVGGYLLLVDGAGNIKSLSTMSQESKGWNYNGLTHLEDSDKHMSLCAVFVGDTANDEGQLSVTLTAECIHVWDEGTVTKTPTCKDEGVITYHCVNEGCNETKTASIPTIDHTWDNGTVTKPATETEEGVKTYTCTVCGDTKEESIPKVKPAGDYFVFQNEVNVVGHFDNNVVGNKWVDENDSHILHMEVTDRPADIWNAKVEITTDYQLEAGKTYVVGVDIDRQDETKNVEVLFKSSNGGDNLEGVYNQSAGDGRYTREFTVDAAREGSLVVLVQFGNAVNTFTIANLKLEEKEVDPVGPVDPTDYLVFQNDVNAIGHFDNNVVGNKWVDENDSHILHMEVTDRPADIWNAKVEILTGYAVEEDKTYIVSVDIDRQDETKNVEVLFKSSVGGDNFEGIYNQDDGDGRYSREFTVDAAREGSLVVLVQFGNAVNTFTIANLKLEEKEAAPADPVDEYFAFTNDANTIGHFYDGVVGNKWVDENDGHILHMEVTGAPANIWSAKVEVTTGYELVAGKTYVVSLDIERSNDEADIEVLFKKDLGSNDNLEGVYNQSEGDGHYTREFTYTGESNGVLYVVIQFGNAVNNIKISNLKLVEKAAVPVEPADEYFAFANDANTVGHFYDGVVGNKWVDEDDGHILHMEVTGAPANIWSAKVEVTTGYELVVGKTYVVSLDIERSNDEANIEVLFKKDLGNDNLEGVYNQSEGDGHYTREFTYTGESNGALYVVIQFGNAVNSIKISNLKLVEKQAAPVDPVEPADEYFAFTNEVNTVGHFYDGVAGNKWVDENDGHILHMEVTGAPANIWSAKVEVTTGYELVVGKTYVVSLDIERSNDEANIEVLFKKDLGNDNLEGVYNQSEGDGRYTREFTYSGESNGALYVVIQFGNAVNNIKISNLKLVEKN